MKIIGSPSLLLTFTSSSYQPKSAYSTSKNKKIRNNKIEKQSFPPCQAEFSALCFRKIPIEYIGEKIVLSCIISRNRNYKLKQVPPGNQVGYESHY